VPSSSILDNKVVAEGKRRTQAVISGGGSTLDEDGEEYARDFQTDDQQVFLWHTANVNLRPVSARPAFRLLGLFGSVDEACAHGRRIAASDPSSPCAIRLSATHAWYSIPREPFDDITPHQLKVNRNLELHKKVIGASADEFRRHKNKLTAGRKPTSVNKLRTAFGGNNATSDGDGGVEETKSSAADPSFSTFAPTTPGDDADEADNDAADDDLQALLQKVTTTAAADAPTADGAACVVDVDGRIAVAPLTRDAEVRNQRYAVVSVLLDYESLRDDVAAVEPGLCVWAAFDTEAEALLYAKKVAAKELPDHDVAVVTMYDWVYPHLMASDKIPYVYRNAELNAIMKHARSSKKQVDDFGKECTARGVAVPVREIEPDLLEPAPVRYTPHADVLDVVDGALADGDTRTPQ
jgi:hypothetical protein